MKALLLLASLFLFNDIEINSQLPPYSHRTEQVAIDSGRTDIEVVAIGTTTPNLSCTYTHLGEVLSKQEHTAHCFVPFNTDLPVYIQVDVQNNENKTVEYRVRATQPMKLK